MTSDPPGDPLNDAPAACSGDGEDAQYQELIRIARSELARHRRRGTLDTRSLVHEAWIRLSGRDPQTFASRKHFYATAAKAMRHVVVDYARSRQAQRRGAGAAPLSLDEVGQQPLELDGQAEHLVHMDAMLDRLAQADPRLVQIVELRFFGGLGVREVAELLGVSEPTIKRGARVARAFLERELAPG